MEEKLSQLRSERDKLKDDIGSEEVTISSVREELSVEQAQLDKERDVIEARDEKLKRDEVRIMAKYVPTTVYVGSDISANN